jgi:hypothetical protein
MSLAFAAAAADLVLARGPLSLEQLHVLAVEAGATKARSSASLRQSLDDRRFVQRPDGRYDTAARLLAGQCFTTRLRRHPVDGVLWTHRDLQPLTSVNRDGGLPLTTGGTLRKGVGPADVWTGPPGWVPDIAPGGLLALRWDGAQLAAEAPADVVAADSPVAQDVRRVLARHAIGTRSRFNEPSLPRIVLGALVEDPELFVRPLPPLSELLPLPEDLRPQDDWPGAGRFEPGTVLQVPVAERVQQELARRADLLGERLPDYVSMLLSAAADRLLPVAPSVPYDSYTGPRYPQTHPDDADVVDLTLWGR